MAARRSGAALGRARLGHRAGAGRARRASTAMRCRWTTGSGTRRSSAAARQVAAARRLRASHHARGPGRYRRLGADGPGDRGARSARPRNSRHLRAGAQHHACCRWRSPGRRCCGARDIFIGVNVVDSSGYPDCRPEFIAAFEALARLATKAGVEGEPCHMHAPLIAMSKAEIIRAGAAAGRRLRAAPCPATRRTRPGRACGRCDSCRLRRAGFAAAGVADPDPLPAALSPQAVLSARPSIRRVHTDHR